MPILINRCFERFESHPEGEEICEADEIGFREESKPYSFRELIDAIRYGETSSYPATGDVHDWVILSDTNDGTRDYYETGARESESIHYARDNPPRNAKYWRLAFIAAGLCKGGQHA
jgi:hypothetical protein